MKTIAICCQKGGVGKSTLTTNLASAFVDERQRAEGDGRDGMRQVGALLNERTKMRLKLIAVAFDRTVQDLIEEAIEGIFKRYERQALARIAEGGGQKPE